MEANTCSRMSEARWKMRERERERERWKTNKDDEKRNESRAAPFGCTMSMLIVRLCTH